ncbi:MAG: hypothetical protein OXH83_01420 [Bryobacterales bacterium]|nr:hypothetical protein [Bryobacterales bacterium]
MKALSRSLRQLIEPLGFAAKLAWEYVESGSGFNPTSAQMQIDPYGFYERMREICPEVVYAPNSGSAFDHLNSVFEFYSFDHLGQALRSV